MPDVQIQTYLVSEVAPYISWSYFFHAWGFKGDARRSPEARQLQADARQMLDEWEEYVRTQCLYRLCQAHAEGDNLVLEEDNAILPLLRQQASRADNAPLLCLSDFVRPLSAGGNDTIGLFASSVRAPERENTGDPYRDLLRQTLEDRLAEATTERMHLYVRRVAWGYAPHEDLPMDELLAGHFQGIRPAVGYPSLPDQSLNFLLDKWLDMSRIGIALTEHGAMRPHCSVSGLMLAHPAARYFAIGRIGQDQLEDYACRRGLPVEVMRKFLATLLE